MASAPPPRSVQDELLLRASTSTLGLMALGPFGGVAMYVMAEHAPFGRRLGFLVYELSTDLLGLILVLLVFQRVRAGRPRSRALMIATPIALFLHLLSWGVVPFLFEPAPPALTYATLFFAIAAVTTCVSTTAAHPPWYAATLTPITVPLIVGIGVGYFREDVPPILALIGVPFLGLLVGSEVVTYRTIREAIAGRMVQEQLAGKLASANTQLQVQAHRDALTGLVNRAHFHELLDEALRKVKGGSRTVAVVYIDLDRFKVVNDSLGHEVGDKLLEQVARRLDGATRGGDVLARIGGDEFTVLLPSLDNGGEAVRIAQRILASLADPFEIGGTPYVIGASVGVAHATSPDDTGADLLRHADAALYLAKGNGRGQVIPFDDRLRSDLAGRLEREVEVRRALDAGEFAAWYQPIVDARSGAIVAVEALARWRHPTRGVVSPAEFLPVLTECGLLADLSLSIAGDARRFRRKVDSFVPSGFRVYVNVTDNRLPLARALDQHAEGGEDGDLLGLGLEITEDTLIGDLKAARAAVERARARGLAVVLDDLGTAYASLALVRELPLDGLKIDRTFVARMLESPADDAVVSAVVALGRRLGCTITAEGVENEAQLAHLRAMGVSRLQGFHFSPAVAPEVVETWLAGAAPWATREGRRGVRSAVSRY